MADLWASFRDCGSAAFLILFLTTLGFVSIIGAAGIVFTSKNRTFALIAAATPFLIGIAIFACGELGRVSGEARTESALEMMSSSSAISPEERAEIHKEGLRESAQCVSLGVGGGMFPLIFGLILLVVSGMRKRPPENDGPPSRNQNA